MNDLEADLLIANAKIKQLEQQLAEIQQQDLAAPKKLSDESSAIETDCQVMNDRFIHWMENEYMKSGYTEAMDFSEYLWRYGDAIRKKCEVENGG